MNHRRRRSGSLVPFAVGLVCGVAVTILFLTDLGSGLMAAMLDGLVNSESSDQAASARVDDEAINVWMDGFVKEFGDKTGRGWLVENGVVRILVTSDWHDSRRVLGNRAWCRELVQKLAKRWGPEPSIVVVDEYGYIVAQGSLYGGLKFGG